MPSFNQISIISGWKVGVYSTRPTDLGTSPTRPTPSPRSPRPSSHPTPANTPRYPPISHTRTPCERYIRLARNRCLCRVACLASSSRYFAKAAGDGAHVSVFRPRHEASQLLGPSSLIPNSPICLICAPLVARLGVPFPEKHCPRSDTTHSLTAQPEVSVRSGTVH